MSVRLEWVENIAIKHGFESSSKSNCKSIKIQKKYALLTNAAPETDLCGV